MWRAKLCRPRGAHQPRQVSRPRLALLLELSQPPVVALDLLPQLAVLDGGRVLVKLQAAHAVESLQVDPALPSDAHAVQDEGGADVDLDKIENKNKNLGISTGAD